MVEHFPHHWKVVGLSPGTGREKMVTKSVTDAYNPNQVNEGQVGLLNFFYEFKGMLIRLPFIIELNDLGYQFKIICCNLRSSLS